MALLQLGVRNLRNIESLDLQPSRGLNIITGDNGAGKTSLLEAIYYLGRGRSFRTHLAGKIRQHHKDRFSVYGQVETNFHSSIPIGIDRVGNQQRIRIHGQAASNLGELVALFPVQIFQPNSYRLIEDSPRYRRHFLDWGLFHVEHGFYKTWKQYQVILRQRNSALRCQLPPASIVVWDRGLCDIAALLDGMRRRYVGTLTDELTGVLRMLQYPFSVQLVYRSGWASDDSLSGCLDKNLERDRRRGFTGDGIHRADLNILLDGTPARDVASRGQLKLLVFALILAQAKIKVTQDGHHNTVLVDDISSELDRLSADRVLSAISNTQLQFFITALDPSRLSQLRNDEQKRFHVEQGRVQQIE